MPGAYEEYVTAVSLNAAVDYSQSTDAGAVGLNRFVTVAGQEPGYFTRAGAASYPLVCGVLASKPAVDQPGRIAIAGIIPLELGATLAANVTVTSGAEGRAVAAGANPVKAIILAGGDAGAIVPALLLI
jgi:hypothetical protein